MDVAHPIRPAAGDQLTEQEFHAISGRGGRRREGWIDERGHPTESVSAI
jgi:hypothetical protein